MLPEEEEVQGSPEGSPRGFLSSGARHLSTHVLSQQKTSLPARTTQGKFISCEIELGNFNLRHSWNTASQDEDKVKHCVTALGSLALSLTSPEL